MKIALRSVAVATLIAAGNSEAFAKIFVKEKFDKDADGAPTDLMMKFENGAVEPIEVDEDKLVDDCKFFIATEIDFEDDKITVMGNPKYDLHGNVVNPELDHVIETENKETAEAE